MILSVNLMQLAPKAQIFRYIEPFRRGLPVWQTDRITITIIAWV